VVHGAVSRTLLFLAGAAILAISLSYALLDIRERRFNADRLFRQCGFDVHCAVEVLAQMAGIENQAVTLAMFDEALSDYQSSMTYCHDNAHDLGMFLHAYLRDIARAVALTDHRCGAGAMHGAIQDFFREQRTRRIPLRDINIARICPRYPDNPYAVLRLQCLHGIGHALMESYHYDVFGAIERCGEFEPEWEQQSCAKGVFMENAEQYYASGRGAFDENDMFFPCNRFGGNFALACYNFQASYMWLRHDFDVARAFGTCDRIIPEKFVRYCYFGMGRSMTVYFALFEDMEGSLTLCQTGRERYSADCFRGIVMTIVNNRDADRGFAFCGFVPGRFREDCYDGLGQWLRMLHSTRRARAKECAKAESPEYVAICMNDNHETITYHSI